MFKLKGVNNLNIPYLSYAMFDFVVEGHSISLQEDFVVKENSLSLSQPFIFGMNVIKSFL